jgi:hypothetical protein
LPKIENFASVARNQCVQHDSAKKERKMKNHFEGFHARIENFVKLFQFCRNEAKNKDFDDLEIAIRLPECIN